MAYNAFLKLEEPQIKGESQKTGHTDEIDLMSFSWGASNSSSVGTGTGVSTGKVSVSDFSIMKSTDISSPTLFQKCCDGTVIKTATVTLERQVASKTTPYLVYTFTNVYVTSVQWSGSGGAGDAPMESVSFTFETCKVQYTQLQDDGTAGEQPEGGWNIGTNDKL